MTKSTLTGVVTLFVTMMMILNDVVAIDRFVFFNLIVANGGSVSMNCVRDDDTVNGMPGYVFYWSVRFLNHTNDTLMPAIDDPIVLREKYGMIITNRSLQMRIDNVNETHVGVYDCLSYYEKPESFPWCESRKVVHVIDDDIDRTCKLEFRFVKENIFNVTPICENIGIHLLTNDITNSSRCGDQWTFGGLNRNGYSVFLRRGIYRYDGDYRFIGDYWYRYTDAGLPVTGFNSIDRYPQRIYGIKRTNDVILFVFSVSLRVYNCYGEFGSLYDFEHFYGEIDINLVTNVTVFPLTRSNNRTLSKIFESSKANYLTLHYSENDLTSFVIKSIT